MNEQPVDKVSQHAAPVRVNPYTSPDFGSPAKDPESLTRYSNSTGKRKVVTVFQKKFVTTAIVIALPLTSRGNISDIKSQDIGPKPT